jgi:hypothetical protein
MAYLLRTYIYIPAAAMPGLDLVQQKAAFLLVKVLVLAPATVSKFDLNQSRTLVFVPTMFLPQLLSAQDWLSGGMEGRVDPHLLFPSASCSGSPRRLTSSSSSLGLWQVLTLVCALYFYELKGQCHEIFLLWFFHQTTCPNPVRHAWKDFKFFLIFEELFVFVIDSVAYSPPWSRGFPVYSSPGSSDSPFDEYTAELTRKFLL